VFSARKTLRLSNHRSCAIPFAPNSGLEVPIDDGFRHESDLLLCVNSKELDPDVPDPPSRTSDFMRSTNSAAAHAWAVCFTGRCRSPIEPRIRGGSSRMVLARRFK
jgi:hypothetical protein